MTRLDNLKILVAESRELDLVADMLEGEGAVVLRCPLVQILDLEDKADAQTWIAEFIARPFDDLILLTGEGLRRLVTLSGVRKDEFIAALGKTRTIIRGPKPARALRELGLNPKITAPEPTSKSIVAVLAQENIEGRRIGVQLYPGEGTQFLLDFLAAEGADISAVTPYRYASEAENEKVADAIHAMAAGKVDIIAFTSTPQIERLASVARELGLEKQLAEGYARTSIASIGPIVEDFLKKHGLAPAMQPESSFHLKPLVRAIIAWRERCR